MKNRILSVALVLPFLAGVLVSCDKADIKFDTTFSKTININLTEQTNDDGSASFSETDTLDLTEGDVQEYIDRLKDVEVVSVYVEVLSADAPQAAVLDGFLISDVYQMTIPPYNVLQAFNDVHKLQLTDDNGFLAYMKEKLLAENKVAYTLNGRVSEVPVNAQLRLTFNLKITARP
jgi:hypothetical protein